MELVAVIVGILALIPVGYLLYDKYSGKIDIDIENVFLAPTFGLNSNFNGCMSLVFCAFKIINGTKSDKTIIKVEIEFMINGKTIIVDSTYVKTFALSEKETNCVCFPNSNGNKNLCLMSWFDLKVQIHDNGTISPEAVMYASALYLLSPIKEDNVNEIDKKIYLIITDSKKRKYIQKFILSESNNTLYKQGTFVKF